jgi:hypothetical protein
MTKKKSKPVKKLLGPKFRVCKCGAKFKYAGRGRPYKECPKCR